jgi:hypothetical protein
VVNNCDRGTVVMPGHHENPRPALMPPLLNSLVDPPALRNPSFAPLHLKAHGAVPAAV